MNNEPTRTTQFLAGDSISENAVRGVFGGRRRTPPTTPTEPVPTGAANPPNAGENKSPAARGLRPLRRWSVAELIARAVAAPSPDGTSRG
jgi:hypothetical protein